MPGLAGKRSFSANCYRNSLRLAAEKKLASVAFPAISTGVYSYPIREAAEVAVRTTRVFITAPSTLREIIFCCFSLGDLKIYEEVLAKGSTP